MIPIPQSDERLLEIVTNPETGMRSILLDDVTVVNCPPDDVGLHEQTVRAVLNRLGVPVTTERRA